MAIIERGYISSIHSEGVRVAIPSRGEYVTSLLDVPAHVENLHVNDMVEIVEHDDLSGAVLAKIGG